MLKSFSLILVVTVLFSCGKDNSNVDLNSYESYFPMDFGTYVDYEVVEIQHDINAEITNDTLFYYLRTVIGDTVTDNEGRLARKFIRKKRNELSDPWVISDVWTALVNDIRVEVTEENKRKVWLILPPLNSSFWDLNAFNVDDPIFCTYDGLHENSSINNISFDSVLTVEQEDVLNLVSFRRKYEQYANNVGLVKKYYKDLNIFNFDTLNIQFGTELIYKCIDFGVE
ncbi:MAG: hypothetical protein CL855_00915 [Cryomorphaceae bacterium]|nr:hypothetical protein [Cryomorphaceae bacterium]